MYDRRCFGNVEVAQNKHDSIMAFHVCKYGGLCLPLILPLFSSTYVFDITFDRPPTDQLSWRLQQFQPPCPHAVGSLAALLIRQSSAIPDGTVHPTTSSMLLAAARALVAPRRVNTSRNASVSWTQWTSARKEAVPRITVS